MSDTKDCPRTRYPVAVLVSIISGRLCCDFGDMHECLEALAGGPVWTHQLPRVRKQVVPALLKRFPELQAATDTKELDDMIERNNLSADTVTRCWLALVRDKHPAIKDEYDVEPVQSPDALCREPIQELIDQRGTSEGIIGVVL